MDLNNHTLRNYDKQLQHLMRLILDMGGEVRKMVLAAKSSFRSDDVNRVAEAKAADKYINALDHQIEEEATIVLKITGMLERAGDLAKNTVKRSVKMGIHAPEEVILKLEKMADIVVSMLDTALEAFERTDTAKATEVWKRDQDIDDLYHEIFALMQKQMSASPECVTPSTHIVFAAKNLERVADYTTNLAKTVYYVNSGKRADKTVLKQEDTSSESSDAKPLH